MSGLNLRIGGGLQQSGLQAHGMASAGFDAGGWWSGHGD